MSLKTIHIVFVISACLMMLFFGAWAWHEYFSPMGTRAHLVYGLLSVAGFVGLLVYGRYFLNKLKHINYL
jgi:hypothetical protein